MLAALRAELRSASAAAPPDQQESTLRRQPRILGDGRLAHPHGAGDFANGHRTMFVEGGPEADVIGFVSSAVDHGPKSGLSVRSSLVTGASRRGIACSTTRSLSAPEAPEASCAAIYDRVKKVAGCGEMLLWRRRDAEQQTGLRRNPRGIPKRQRSRRQSGRQRFLGDRYVRCAVRQSQHHC